MKNKTNIKLAALRCWLSRLVRFPATRRARKALFLAQRAMACERRAFEYEQNGDTFRAGRMAGQAAIYNMWATSLKSNNLFMIQRIKYQRNRV